MANKNDHVVIAYFPTVDNADQCANQIKDWDKANDDIKLGGIGILSWEKGKVRTHKVGRRAGGTGAKWGTALGVTAGILSGGVSLIGGAIAGAAGGAVLGSFFHKSLGLSDDDKARLEKHLQGGGAALVVMADEDEIEPTQRELDSMGGDVENYKVPVEILEVIDETSDVQPVEEEAVVEDVEKPAAEVEAEVVEEETVEVVAESTGDGETLVVEEEAVAEEEVVAAIDSAEQGAAPENMTKFARGLQYIEGIGPKYAASLKEAGVDSPRTLLVQGASRKGRAEIASKSGISAHLILTWVHHVDLFRVRGLGRQYARLLDAAGVDTVPELAQRNPEHLQQALAATNQEKHLVHEVPGLSQTESWVAQAKELPRVVTY